MNKPYLSIVVVGRNDNYGGDFIERLQRGVDWNTQLLENYKIPTEFIIVNWNPVPENKPIEQLIRFPENRKHVIYKIITVPPEVHKQYINAAVRQTVPVFEFIAKNAGIRRAKGEYILCINADILIHPNIFKFISDKKINKQHFYRTNRLDFKDVNSYDSLNDFYQGGYVVALKGIEYYFKSFFDKRVQYHIFRCINAIKIPWEFWKFRNYKLSNLLGLPVIYDNSAYYAHCLCSGDFMLMHRDHWLELNAYPEYTIISTHTDSIFTIFAYFKLKEYVFSQPIFHQEHVRRYTWDAIKNESPFIEAYHKFTEITQDLLSGKKINNFMNNETWGLGLFNLQEKNY